MNILYGILFISAVALAIYTTHKVINEMEGDDK